MNEGNSQETPQGPSLVEALRKSLGDFLKNKAGIPPVEILRRQLTRTGRGGRFTPLSEAFKEAVEDRGKLREK